MRHTPRLFEDARHLVLVAACGLLGLAATAGLRGAGPSTTPPARAVSPPVATPALAAEVATAAEPSATADRLYGRVLTRSGRELTGYLQWNGREASWADRLPATHPGGPALAGTRFGHVARIEVEEGGDVVIHLKSGDVDRLVPSRPAGSAGLAPVRVEGPAGVPTDVAWSDVAAIELLAEPVHGDGARRLHGTVQTRSGHTLTGYLTWDERHRFQDDVLTGVRAGLPFSLVSSIRPLADGGVFVETASGVTARLHGTTETGSGHRGVVVADPGLGSVTVPFERLREVTLHPPEAVAAYDDFDGGRALHGTVVTSGRSLRGAIRWDLDESATWESLDGQHLGVQYHVELGNVASIEPLRLGAEVELRDGRRFYLIGSNDVNWSNRGIEVTEASGAVSRIAWAELERVRFER